MQYVQALGTLKQQLSTNLLTFSAVDMQNINVVVALQVIHPLITLKLRWPNSWLSSYHTSIIHQIIHRQS